jgi:ferredoxin
MRKLLSYRFASVSVVLFSLLFLGCDLSLLRKEGFPSPAPGQFYPENERTFRVRFQHPSGAYDLTLICPDDVFLLDCMENNGLEHSYGSRAGADSVDAVRVLSGSVDQSDQSFLNADQISAGFALISVAYATSHAHILTEQEDALY